MTRDFLAGLTLPEGAKLDKAAIDAIMGENGKDINALKETNAAAISALENERDGYKEQLDTAQTALKGFEGVDVEELQTKISQLTTEIDSNKSKYEAEIADIKFSNLLSGKVTSSGAKNAKAVMSLLDIEALKSSKNQEKDIEAAIKAVKESDGYMFADENHGTSDGGNNEQGESEQQKSPQFTTGNLNTSSQRQESSGFNFGFVGVRPHDNK